MAVPFTSIYLKGLGKIELENIEKVVCLVDEILQNPNVRDLMRSVLNDYERKEDNRPIKPREAKESIEDSATERDQKVQNDGQKHPNKFRRSVNSSVHPSEYDYRAESL